MTTFHGEGSLRVGGQGPAPSNPGVVTLLVNPSTYVNSAAVQKINNPDAPSSDLWGSTTLTPGNGQLTVLSVVVTQTTASLNGQSVDVPVKAFAEPAGSAVNFAVIASADQTDFDAVEFDYVITAAETMTLTLPVA